MKGFIKDEIPSRWDENQMTHDELLAKISPIDWRDGIPQRDAALRAVVELHKPEKVDYPNFETRVYCQECRSDVDEGLFYPCLTIQAIEKELNG